MSLGEIERIANSEVVFGLLFVIFLFWYLRKSSKEKETQRIADESRDRYMMDLHREREDTLKEMLAENRSDALSREAELSSSMRKMVDQQERIGDTLKEVSYGLTELEKKVDTNVLEIWKVMAQGGNAPPKEGQK